MISKKKIILLLIISIGGSITSSFIFIFTINTGSWKYSFLTNDMEVMGCCSISSNGQYIVVGGRDNQIHLFEKFSSNPQWSYRATDNIGDVDMSANGQYIVAGSTDGIVYLFDRTSSDPLWSYSTGWGVYDVGISADGNYIFACDLSDLYLFSRSSNNPLWIKPTAVRCAEISADGSSLVSLDNGLISYFHTSSSTPLWQYDTGEQYTFALSMTPNGKYFATGGQDDKIHLFNNTQTTPLQIYSVGSSVRSLAFSDDGTYLAAGCANGLYLYNNTNFSQLWGILGREGREVDISSDGSFIAFGTGSISEDHDLLYLFNKNSNIRLWEEKITNRVQGVKISADGSLIAVAADLNFYLFNSNNPTIDTFYEAKLIGSIIGLASFIGMGAAIGVLHLFLRRSQAQKEKIHIEKEKMQQEITGVIETLDGKFKEWEENENEKI